MHPVSMEEKGVVQGKPSAETFMIILYKTRLHSAMVYNIHVYVLLILVCFQFTTDRWEFLVLFLLPLLLHRKMET